jgi:small subunit ribosomal protein S9
LTEEQNPHDDEPTPDPSPEPSTPEPLEAPEAEVSSEATAASTSDETSASDAPDAAPVAPEPVAESTPEPEPVAESAEPEAESTPEPEPVAESTPEPVAESTPEPEPESAPEPEPITASEPAGEPEAPVAPAAPQAPEPAVTGSAPAAGGTEEEFVEDDATPRVKPAIPGADLIPDIITDGDQFLDAEARAAAEAEAEEAAARAAAGDPEMEAQPIADAAIDLAAGARYTATGKRKTAVARVILKPGAGTYSINGKSLEEFFPRQTLQRTIRHPLETVGYESRMDVVARMHGGGVAAQAGALRHGISRALLEADPNLRGELKRRGFLTRDPRVKERKKAGLKKARKRPQFSKR